MASLFLEVSYALMFDFPVRRLWTLASSYQPGPATPFSRADRRNEQHVGSRDSGRERRFSDVLSVPKTGKLCEGGTLGGNRERKHASFGGGASISRLHGHWGAAKGVVLGRWSHRRERIGTGRGSLFPGRSPIRPAALEEGKQRLFRRRPGPFQGNCGHG